MGSIRGGFHYLGIHYLPTRTEDNITMTPVNDDAFLSPPTAHSLSDAGGGKTDSKHQEPEPIRMVPHHFVIGWVKTAEIWCYEELLHLLFIATCWEINPAAIAAGLLQKWAALSDLALLGTDRSLHKFCNAAVFV